MSSLLIGRFYFKLTSNGNLLGEFSNNLSTGISTEGADQIDNIENIDNYLGDYNSTWQEKGISRFATLKISQKTGTGNKIFTLEWRESRILIFIGEGMLCDNILIGDYQKVK